MQPSNAQSVLAMLGIVTLFAAAGGRDVRDSPNHYAHHVSAKRASASPAPILVITDVSHGLVLLPSATTGPFIVGQNMRYSVKASDGSLLSNIQWTIYSNASSGQGGYHVPTYAATPTNNQKQSPVSPIPLTMTTGTSLSAYLQPGSLNQVSVQADFDGAPGFQFAVVNALTPSVAATVIAQPLAVGRQQGDPLGHSFVELGGAPVARPSATGIPGMQFSWSITAPANGSGKVFAAQTSVDCELFQNLVHGTMLYQDEGGRLPQVPYLDTAYPYAIDVGETPMPIVAGRNGTYRQQDSPSFDLTANYEDYGAQASSYYATSFTTDLMYQPSRNPDNTTNTIAVPLSQVTWNFRGGGQTNSAPTSAPSFFPIRNSGIGLAPQITVSNLGDAVPEPSWTQTSYGSFTRGFTTSACSRS